MGGSRNPPNHQSFTYGYITRKEETMFIQNKTHFSIRSIGILTIVVLISFCSYLAAEDTPQTTPNLSPAEIGSKYQEIKAIYKKITNQTTQARLEQLVEMSSEFVTSFPEYKRIDEVYYYLGNTLVRLKRVEEGITVFEKLIDEHPEARYVQPSLLELGMAYDSLSNHDKADEIYTKLIEHPKFEEKSYAKLAKKILEQDKSERKGIISNRAAASTPRPSEWVGKPAPEFQVKDLKGEELTLEKYRGQVVLLDFWATWCGPCINELPNVKKTYQEYKDKKFQIIGISLDRSQQPLEAFVKKEELGWVHHWDQGGKIANQYGVTGIPSMFLLDGEGVIRKTNLRGRALETSVAELVKENLTKPAKSPTKTDTLESDSKPKSIPATKLIKPKPALQNEAPSPIATKVSDWIGKPAPDFKVTDVKGDELSLEDYRGQVVLLDFWATWCGPCIKEMPKLKKTFEKYKDQNFQIIGISLDRSKPPLEAYIEKEELAWEHYWDQDRKVREQYGVRAIPTAFLIDGEGIIRKASLGGFDVESAVAELVKENHEKTDKPTEPTKTPTDSPEIVQNAELTIKEIIDAAVEAHGGLEKLQSVKNIVIESQSFEYLPNGIVQDEGRSKTYYLPDKFRSDWDTDSGNDSIIYDGDSLFQLTNGKNNEIPVDKVMSTILFFKDSLFREPIWLLTNLAQNKIPVEYAGTADIKGDTASILLITQPSGRKLKAFFSEKTSLLVKYIHYYEIAEDNETVEVSLDEYRDVDGIHIAHHRTTKNGEVRQVLITDIKLNAEIDAALFSPDKINE